MTNEVWVLPEEGNYSIEFFQEGKWIRRQEYGTFREMKSVALNFAEAVTVRVIKVSRYDPHPATAVVFYREAQR